MNECTVYIDEAGDLGIGKGTRWFVLSAVIVNKEAEKSIREKIAHIKSEINVHEIHLRKITDFNKRAFIVRELSTESFVYMNIVVDTENLINRRFLHQSLPTITSANICYNGCHGIWRRIKSTPTLFFLHGERLAMAN